MLAYIIQFCEIGFIIANFYPAFATFKTQTFENFNEVSQDSPWYVTGRNVTFSSRVSITECRPLQEITIRLRWYSRDLRIFEII